ncbi:MAG: hypothetical protein KGJ07_06475 [Patescibacteria group bacterium]|nr:hypothetical protein [Patescibacteria group bacterium]
MSNILDDFFTTNNGGGNLGDSGSHYRIGTPFKSTVSAKTGKITLTIKKVGSPSDNLGVAIYNDSSNVPGTDITPDSATVSGSTLTTSYATYDFTWSVGGGVLLSAGTQFWIVIFRSGTNDGSNYYNVALGTPNHLVDSQIYDGSSWSTEVSGYSMWFQEYYDNTTVTNQTNTELQPNIGGLHMVESSRINNIVKL